MKLAEDLFDDAFTFATRYSMCVDGNDDEIGDAELG
jgi:hypothetical protein